MQIVELRAENFKRIEAVEIKPDGSVVIISGANNAGKSSVVDAIFAALQARTMLKEIPEPVRTGQKGATITLDLGEYKVVRNIEPSGKTRLTVTAKSGAPVKSPQGVIDGLLASLCIDPSAFTKLKPADQVEMLVQLVDTEGFLEKNEESRLAWYAHRTEKGRTRDQCKAVLDAAPRPDLPDVKPNPEGIKTKLDQARNDSVKRFDLLGQKTRTIKEVNGIAQEITNLQESLEKYKAALAAIVNELENLPPEADIEAIEQEHSDAILVLAKFDQMEAWGEAGVKHEAAEKAYADATNNLTIIADNRKKWLSRAELPVPGLGFDFETPCVMYDGVPLQQASTSQQLRVGAAIAMACKPGLSVIRIKDGNCLDAASMEMVTTMAEENDFQLWIEKVDDSGDIGFYIEDGRLAAVNGEPVT